MKKPRVEDFDPNAVPALGSPIDDYPTIERPKVGIRPTQTPEKHPVSAPVLPLKTSIDDIPANTPPPPIMDRRDADLPANLQTSKPASLQDSLPANQQGSKPVYPQTSKPVNVQTSKQTKKFSSYLVEASIRALKRLALDEDKKDYEVLQEALDEYLREKGYNAR
jgi:hypothetical protein